MYRVRMRDEMTFEVWCGEVLVAQFFGEPADFHAFVFIIGLSSEEVVVAAAQRSALG